MPPFINKDGKTFHPFIDVLPAGAENIHHLQTRKFIGGQWREFTLTFTSLTEVGRAERLRTLIKDWETAYLAKYKTAQMTGVMLEIRNLAARSALTAWLARQPTPISVEVGNFYAKLLRYSTDLMGGHTGPVYQHPGAGVVTPHLAFTAARVAGLHPEDTVRVDDAGDGLLATFIGDQQRHVQYVDVYSLRRAIFNQLFPQLEIGSHSTAPADVLFTNNTNPSPPHVLIRGVHPGGRLIIYGDRDWHHISAEVIGKLQMFSSFHTYAASLPSTLDDSTRIMHTELFANWKGLNKQINGTLHFKGELSTYQSESGVVIVVDNINGPNTHYEAFNLANPQARPFTDYILSFDAVRNTRQGTDREVVEHHRPEQKERRTIAKVRRKASINEKETGTIVGDTSIQTVSDPTIPQENSEIRNRAFQIQQICTERGITTLLHFTRLENLESILREGLLGRSLLEARGQQFLFNDLDRVDGHKETSCLSISFPNYQMFYSIREQKKNIQEAIDSQWIVLLLDVKVLWELDCAFCQRNAAHKTVRSILLEDRKKPEALKGMFGDFYNIKHQDLSIPENYPTHPQAEVLVFDSIPAQYIKTVHFRNETALEQWRFNYAGTYFQTFSADRQYFNARVDYEIWRPTNFNNQGIPLSYIANDDVDNDDNTLIDDDIPF